MYQKVTVVSNEQVIPGYMRMVISCPDMAAAAQPGQFMMLKAWEGYAPFLMRPISINFADPKEGTMTFLYKVVGEGTERMAALREGEYMQALGPLGHGFPIPKDAKRVAVIGRGIGIAPLLLLAKWALDQGAEVYAYLSAKSDDQIFDKAEMETMGVTVRSTSDSNVNVTSFLAEDLKTMKFDAAFSCGSKRLMTDMHNLGLQHGFETYVSLEEHMACGIGACKGCVCKTHDKDGSEQYETVCKCGPVFPTERIV